MSMREHGYRHEAWAGEAADFRAGDAGPVDCDCDDTIRELLVETATMAALVLLILLALRTLA